MVLVDNLVVHNLEPYSQTFIWLQQIIKALVVYFKVTHLKSKLSAFVLYAIVHVAEDIPDRPWNDTVLSLDVIRDIASLLDYVYDFVRSKH